MKRMRNILSFLLALCMVCSVGFPIFVRAEEPPALSMEASTGQLQPGEIVILTVRAELDADIRGAGMTFVYDPEILELLPVESETTVPFSISDPIPYADGSKIRVSFAPREDAVSVQKGQVLAAVAFRALRHCDRTALSAASGYFYDEDLAELSVQLPDSVVLKVDKPAPKGVYTVTMPEHMAAMTGDIVRLPVKVDSIGDLTDYHDFDLSFTFDPQMLKLIEVDAENAQVDVQDGLLNVLACGEGRPVGTVAMELIFQLLQSGETQVTLISAQVDNSENAVDSNTAAAQIENGTTLIYPAEPSEPTVPTEPTEPSEPTVPTEPTEPSEPTVPTEPTEPSEPTVPTEPTEPSEPSVSTEPTEPDRPTEPDYPIGSETVDVVFAGSGATDANGSDTARMGRDYTFRIRREKGYAYTVTASVYGESVSVNADPDSDSYTIPGRYITGTLTIHIEKKPTVEVSAYLTMNERTMYLILYHGTLASDYVAQYDGQSMYWSPRYQAYAWLVESPDADVVVNEIALEKIRVVKGQPAGLVNYSGNVDLSLHMDVSDAELVWEMYNAEYTLEEMELLKFLNADVNTDKRLDVRDAARIAKLIYGRGGA